MSDRAHDFPRALEHGLFAILPVAWLAILLYVWSSRDVVAFDFHHYYWPAGDRVLHGLSPYVHGPWYPSEVPVGFVYPAPAAVLFGAVSLIPRGAGDIIFTILALAAPFVALRLLDVRDWRCYGIVVLWSPITFGVQTANLSMLLTVAVAAMWRYRDRQAAAGVLLGAVVAVKLFLVPLGLFFLATRRYVAVACSAIAMLAITAMSWIVVGLDEFDRYRATVREFTGLREDNGYSVIGFVDRLGGGRPLAYAIALSLAACAGVACLVAGRRGREDAALVLALVASLLVTPIMWLHYFALLIVPLALRYPRLHPVWALPILLWAAARVHPSAAQVVLALVLAAAVIVASLRQQRPPAVTAPARA